MRMYVGYCGLGEHGWSQIFLSFAVIWLGSDLFEFTYHRMGHSNKYLVAKNNT